MTDQEFKPKGVVAILTGPDGRVWATATSFGTSRPGGFSLLDTQKRHAREKLGNEYVKSTVVPDMFEVMRGYDCQQVVNDLVQKKQYRVELVPINHDQPE